MPRLRAPARLSDPGAGRRRPLGDCLRMHRVLVTGSAGFIGYHLSRALLDQGHTVIGYDALTDYYDVALKERRHAMLLQHPGFSCTIARLEDFEALDRVCRAERPDIIVHLAAQAGVRYSLENPRAY